MRLQTALLFLAKCVSDARLSRSVITTSSNLWNRRRACRVQDASYSLNLYKSNHWGLFVLPSGISCTVARESESSFTSCAISSSMRFNLSWSHKIKLCISHCSSYNIYAVYLCAAEYYLGVTHLLLMIIVFLGHDSCTSLALICIFFTWTLPPCDSVVWICSFWLLCNTTDK